MRCARRARGSPLSAWCGNTSPSTTSPRCGGSSRRTIRRRPDQRASGGADGRDNTSPEVPAAEPRAATPGGGPRGAAAPDRSGRADRRHPSDGRVLAVCPHRWAGRTALPAIAPETQVLHAHDWHTALAPVYLRTAFASEPFHERLAVVTSVHNAGFQGHFPPETLAELGLPAELYHADVFEWYGR